MGLDRERVLMCWALGFSQRDIAEAVGCDPRQVGALLSRARKAGDLRAHRRDAYGVLSAALVAHRSALKAREHRAVARAALLQRAARFPTTIDELVRAAREARVPVRKCPPGIHAGWRPRWA